VPGKSQTKAEIVASSNAAGNRKIEIQQIQLRNIFLDPKGSNDFVQDRRLSGSVQRFLLRSTTLRVPGKSETKAEIVASNASGNPEIEIPRIQLQNISAIILFNIDDSLGAGQEAQRASRNSNTSGNPEIEYR
jgi:hypothetical protein